MWPMMSWSRSPVVPAPREILDCRIAGAGVAQHVRPLYRARLIIYPHSGTAFLYNLFVLPVNDNTTTLCPSYLRLFGRTGTTS